MNSQSHKDFSEDSTNPPIFNPSNTNDSSLTNVPPSFIPTHTKQTKTTAHHPSTTQAPSFAPQTQRKQVRTSNQFYTQQPVTYAPHQQQPKQVRQIHPAPHIHASTALNNVAEAAAQMPVKKSHRFLHVFLALLTILVITCMGLGVYSWHWVDSRMNRTSWLTNTPSAQGTAWLILGSDQRDGEEAKEITGFRTDTILVLTKPSNGHSSLISIPRDSLISFNGEHMKINSVAQFAGNKALTSVVESITGHRIDHVAEIRFNGLTNVVNALDGIDLCYNRTVSDRFSGLHWTSGCHHVDGATALAFSRMRYADPQSDFGRAARQRMVIAAIMKKALARDTITNLGKIKKLAKAGLSSVLLDEKSNPGTLWEMAQAFREATGSQGVSGTIYWTNPDYQVPGIGSSVLLDDAKNLDLFNQLAAGTHKPGAVGTLAELQNTAF